MALEQDEGMAAMEAMREHTEVLRAFAGTEVHRSLVKLLDALRTSYMLDLVDITPSQLEVLQGAMRQVQALKRAISGGEPTLPRI